MNEDLKNTFATLSWNWVFNLDLVLSDRLSKLKRFSGQKSGGNLSDIVFFIDRKMQQAIQHLSGAQTFWIQMVR